MENSCLKKYKPSSKKWILASRCAGLRRNSALIPANAGLFHYSGNNPVRYIDPDGRFPTVCDFWNFARKNSSGDTKLLATGMVYASSSEHSPVKMPSFPNLKEIHYARNNKQKNEMAKYPTRKLASSNNYKQLGIENGADSAEMMDNYHEMGYSTKNSPSPKNNDKLVKMDPSGNGKGSFELVYDGNGNLVTDPVNQGTYNYCDASKSKVGHFFMDMLPYYIWGNSPDDPTTMGERFFGDYQYSVTASKDEAAKARNEKSFRDAHIW